MTFDYDSKLSDPNYHGGMININSTDKEETKNMEGWEKDDE